MSGRVTRVSLVLLAALATASPRLAATRDHPDAAQTTQTPGVFTCGVDQQIPPIAVTWMAMVLIGDDRMYAPCPVRPIPHPADHRENREFTAFVLGRNSRNEDVRWRAAQATVRMKLLKSTMEETSNGGRELRAVAVDGSLGSMMGRPLPPIWIPVCDHEVHYFGSYERLRRWQAGPMFRMLLDDNPEIRMEAAYAIGTYMAVENLEGDLVTAVVKELQACWQKQTDPNVQGQLLASVGVIRYANDAQRLAAEEFLVKESQGPNVKVLGAVSGLEAMLRRMAQPNPTDVTRQRLKQLLTFGKRSAEAPLLDAESRIRRLALSALLTARDNDLTTIMVAAGDEDWQMRRLIASRLNLLDPAQAPIAERIAVDPAFQVRFDFLSAVGRWVGTTKLCGPLVERFKDPSPAVVMRAMDLISANCTDLEDSLKALMDPAGKLMKPEPARAWHVPVRALMALARLSPEEARPRLADAIKHPAWQVRAAVAAAAVPVNDEQLAITLMDDQEPNVRTAALDALGRLKSAALVPQAIATLLNATDYQLLLTAATTLKNMPVDARPAAAEALLSALRRLTDEATDPSRDPRIAIIERLEEVMPPERASDLLTYVSDYDDEVAKAASKAFQTLVGAPPAGAANKQRRYPYQPTADQLAHQPTEALVQLEGGFVSLHLLNDVAPIAVARFVELATQGFYNDRTFHRVVPNFIVQGGSPAANEYVGTTRYLRDEVGPQAWHVRGAVGISSRGIDTGDGQIFIDLVDLPRLDRDYTVFAYVTSGMDLVDQLLDGAKILSVSVK